MSSPFLSFLSLMKASAVLLEIPIFMSASRFAASSSGSVFDRSSSFSASASAFGFLFLSGHLLCIVMWTVGYSM